VRFFRAPLNGLLFKNGVLIDVIELSMVVLRILQLTKPYEENQAFLHQM
jgi:hypothetical protein